MKAIDVKKQSKLVAEGIQKQSSWIQTILGKIKIKRRVQNLKNLGKQLQLQQVAMIGLLMTPGGGKRKGIAWTGDEPT